MWGLLTTLYPRNDLIERRRDNRYPFPCLIHLTPVGPDGVTPEGETVVVVGKHLSEHGFGFYHQAPLPHRRMIASLESKQGALAGVSDRSELVPFHQGRLVRERRPLPADGALAAGEVTVGGDSPSSPIALDESLEHISDKWLGACPALGMFSGNYATWPRERGHVPLHSSEMRSIGGWTRLLQ